MNKINSFQLLELALKIESRGRDNYKYLSLRSEDPSLRKLFQQLSEWENLHLDFFTSLKKEASLAAANRFKFDPSDYMGLSLLEMEEIASETIPDNKLNLNDDLERKEIIKNAIDLEKLTINFYEGLKRSVKDSEAKGKLNTIIQEERKHIKILQQALNYK